MLKDLFERDFIFLDGAMGTQLQKKGLKPGENPMTLNITRPDMVEAVYASYARSGSDIITANTFGANAKKLKGSGYGVEEIITAAVGSAKKMADAALVALDMSPIGELLAPLGTLTFDGAYNRFKEQAVAGEKAGADIALIETMTDLNEARAAILAVKENTSLPVFVTMTFEKNGRTFTGCLPESFAAVCSGLGVQALGVNCSLGPGDLKPIIQRLAGATDLPLILKPNAGLPDPMTGEYDIGPEEFASQMADCIEAGVKLVGGCCGTDPDYIKALRLAFESKKYVERETRRGSFVCSPSKFVEWGRVRVIGERINPTGKKQLKKALVERDMEYVMEEAVRQTEAGADILDINVGIPGIDEPVMMQQTVRAVQSVTNLPLQIDSSNPAALEAGLRAFPGRAIVNSVNGEQSVLDAVLPIVKKYGALVVGLTLDENGIPETAEGRLEIAHRILDAALGYGIRREDVLIDCLTLTVSARQESAGETLRALGMVKEKLGLRTVLGVSNISFGLPNRELVNSGFLTLALKSGLDLPIIDPTSPAMMDTVAVFNLLSGGDAGGEEYIKRFAAAGERTALPAGGNNSIAAAILKGLPEEAAEITRGLLGELPELEIINKKLIPALDDVGQRFETGEIFLPQLLSASAAAGAAFDMVKESLAKSGKRPVSGGTIVIATVKGDIHDIGKNIVKVVLENYGYRVIDLGKNVPAKAVVEAVIREKAGLVGLSALMTTTLEGMEETIKALRESGCGCKIMVGGAVLTPAYAEEIGADFYAKDARESAQIAGKVLGGIK